MQKLKEIISRISSEMFGWIAVMIMHAATVPSFMAFMSGVNNTLPQIDIVLMIWGGLVLFFIKAIISKDFLNIITIGLGFAMQAVMLALIFVK
jgi:hypothetical protein